MLCFTSAQRRKRRSNHIGAEIAWAIAIIYLFCSLCSWRTAAQSSLTHYVDSNSQNPVVPYTNWATAARIIQDALDTAVAGDTVLVTNGIYETGGRVIY